MTKKNRKVFQSDNITIEDIERGLKTLAKVVSLYGETYLPIFNRLHDEFLKAQASEANKKLALDLALQYSQIE